MGERNSEKVNNWVFLTLKKENINRMIKLIANNTPNASQGNERVELVPMSMEKGIVNTNRYHK